MVAAVATLEPEVAANIAQAAMLECISPPGSHGTHSTSALYMRSAMPERSRISPSSTKNGIATSRKLFDVAHAISPMARRERQLRIDLARARGRESRAPPPPAPRARAARSGSPSAVPSISVPLFSAISCFTSSCSRARADELLGRRRLAARRPASRHGQEAQRPDRKNSASPASQIDCGITVGVCSADWLREPEAQDCCTTLQPCHAIRPKNAEQAARARRNRARGAAGAGTARRASRCGCARARAARRRATTRCRRRARSRQARRRRRSSV